MSALVADRLRRRARTAGGEPLITYYEIDTGVRTELSAVTFANWVDKTCNLVVDELLLESGDVVELALTRTHPGHWMTACWQVACWQLGLTVSVGSGLPPKLMVTGPDWHDHLGNDHRDSGVDVLACSMHPLGLGLTPPPDAPVLDFALEVRGQPDGFVAAPQSGLRLAWADAERQLTQADLIANDSPAVRRLVRPSDPWTTARDGIIAALVTGGSTVHVVGGDEAQLARIAADERVDDFAP